MNLLIAKHFDTLEARLIVSPVVLTFDVVRREVTPVDGKIRVRATLLDGGLLELFEYVTEDRGQVRLRKYGFHWQGANGDLVRRWDNANHYSGLPGEPHHVHLADGSVTSVPAPDLSDVLREIDQHLYEKPSSEGENHA